MGQEELKKIFRKDRYEDDEATLADEGTGGSANGPASVVYIPDEGFADSGFSNDTTTLFDGSSGPGSSSSALGKPGLKVSLQQLHYNQSKLALDRAINQTMELLYELIRENKERPIFYPTDVGDSSSLLNSTKAHLALVRNKTVRQLEQAKVGDAPDFKVLKLEVKMSKNSENYMGSLDKKSVASLLEQKLNQQVKYLLNLKERVDDTSSKVFVTGDLNAGKSTFCNALLRRKVLPEDQQPCTSVFCEVIDAKGANNGREEVHAIPIGAEYDIRNEFSYEVHQLSELEDLVYECDKYLILKVYVLDNRKFHESLLSNGVIDIKLIDAPGLNMDLYQTTQVFSRQEEIDLVVFVVNSENHFTLSAKEFIAAAAAEKRYVFIVVNRFDNIRDKNKCMARILDQVKSLSPDTHKNALDFVHFVSSTEALEGSPDGGDGGDDDPDHSNEPFDHLEASLRKFILEKRAISKLLPAKSYMMNILTDLRTLLGLNEKIYQQEKEDKHRELREHISPKYEDILSKSSAIGDSITRLVERTCTEIYDVAKADIVTTLSEFGDSQVVYYLGLQNLYEYAQRTQKAMFDTILSAVRNSEEKAKALTETRVGEITALGKANLGDEFLHDKVFKSDLMFTRRRDTIKKNLDTSIEISDFFDPLVDSMLMWLGVPRDFVATTRSHINQFNPAAILTTLPRNTATLKNQIPTQLTLHTLYSSGKILTTGAVVRKLWSMSYVLKPLVLKRVVVPIFVGVGGFLVYYLVNDIPNAFPRKQARKIKRQIAEMDYVHVNADRIAKECRLVLNYPARQVMNNFQTSIDKRSAEKEKIERVIRDADLSHAYFRGLQVKIDHQMEAVSLIDLENVNTVD